MVHITDSDRAIIAVPLELKDKILSEGYRCTKRNRVPCSRLREGALRAYRRFNQGKPHAFLEIIALPPGVTADIFKDGIKINASYLPPSCFALDYVMSALRGFQQHGGTSFRQAAQQPAPAFHTFSPFARQSDSECPSQLALNDIYYTQDSIADHFQDGRTLQHTRKELEAGLSVNRIPVITVVKHNGRWLSVDNRRLCVFKRVFFGSYNVPVKHGVRDHRFYNKLKQPNGGTSIFVRGRGF
eukprot:TRINITY_DN73015_c0_g1_i1.p1 TRINITY_DN73015_c0_g1~~TRINITY_DN73015_c0_g1_i1.p1  ORF type:complete len:242 (+),score=31.45 TRINITY_DN73015_c0_g1_i1:50-775(+)